ncbi:MAG: nucleotide exchange factor GrpE [Isosphaerales bacterium]
MSEIDKAADATPGAGDVEASPSAGGTDAAPDDEPGLEVLEGLAEEDEAPAASAEPGAAPRNEEAALLPWVDGSLLRDALKDLGDDLGRRLDMLRAIFERELRAEATRERVIDRLHAELQEYKQDLLLKVQRPIFVDLIQLHDDVGKMIEARSSSDAGALQAGAFRSILESIQTAIEDILYRQGVEPFALEGNEFDPRRQRAISTLATDDAALNKTIASRLRKGFLAGDKVIRPEIVTVFTLRQGPGAE